MKILEMKENATRGSGDFLIQIYNVNKYHNWYAIPIHWHEEHEIIKITKGRLYYKIGADKDTANSGDILYVNSGVLHSTLPEDKECEYFCIVFDLASFIKNDLASGKILKPLINGEINVYTRLSDSNDENVSSIIQHTADILSKRVTGNELLLQGFLFLLFGNIIQACLL